MKKKLLSMLVLLAAVATGAWAQTETLLTTITATAKEQASYSTANVATVSFSYTAGGSSAYLANWGWWGYGWSATVNAAEGYTITKCVFYDDQNRTATDSEAPFVVETTEEDKTPQVNGTPILAYTSKGIKKIEVYGYVTPAGPTSFTVSLKNGTADADKWTIEPVEAKEGDEIKATYTGKLKVKSVKAVKKGDAAPEKTYYYGDGYYTVDGGSGGITTKEQHNSLVDNNLGTKWGQNKPNGGWYIEFHTASAIQVNGYMLRTGNDTQGQSNRNPTDWVLKGKKNSGDSWTVIDTKVNNNDLPNENDAETDFDVATPGEYRYFRLEISNNKGNGGFMQLSEMRLFKYVTWNATTKQATFTMLDGDVELEVEYYAESNLYLSEDALKDKASIAVTAGELGVQFGEDGKSANTITEGTAMTVKYNGAKKVIGVKAVKKAPATVPVTAITLNKTETSIKVGSTETLSVTAVAPDNATDKTYTWKTSDESKATVDQDGKVTAVAAGTVTIYAEANDGSGVKGNCSVTVTPATITVTINQSDWGDWDTSITKDGVTVSASMIDPHDGNLMEGGTFSTTLGNFTKIVVTTYRCYASGTGWSGGTWTGTPASTVSFSGNFMGRGRTQTTIVCTIVPKN